MLPVERARDVAKVVARFLQGDRGATSGGSR